MSVRPLYTPSFVSIVNLLPRYHNEYLLPSPYPSLNPVVTRLRSKPHWPISPHVPKSFCRSSYTTGPSVPYPLTFLPDHLLTLRVSLPFKALYQTEWTLIKISSPPSFNTVHLFIWPILFQRLPRLTSDSLLFWTTRVPLYQHPGSLRVLIPLSCVIPTSLYRLPDFSSLSVSDSPTKTYPFSDLLRYKFSTDNFPKSLSCELFLW